MVWYSTLIIEIMGFSVRIWRTEYDVDNKKPGKRPLYVYYFIAIAVIFLINLLVLPAFQERSVEKTDYSTFLSNVDRGNVSKAEVQEDYIYYEVRKNGKDTLCKTVRMEDPDLVDRLYEAGTKMEAVAPQKQSLILSLIAGICHSHCDFYSSWKMAQQKNDEIYGIRRAREA